MAEATKTKYTVVKGWFGDWVVKDTEKDTTVKVAKTEDEANQMAAEMNGSPVPEKAEIEEAEMEMPEVEETQPTIRIQPSATPTSSFNTPSFKAKKPRKKSRTGSSKSNSSSKVSAVVSYPSIWK